MKIEIGTLRALALMTGMTLGSVASAATIEIFGTGLDAAGNAVAHNSIGDAHYDLLAGAPVPGVIVRAITSAGGTPIPPFLGDSSDSRWLVVNNPSGTLPTTDPTAPTPPANPTALTSYSYQTFFDLTGLDPSTAMLTGRWASDDQAGYISLNGVQVATGANPTSWTDFSITSNFVAGQNTLAFVLPSTLPDSYSAVRVEISGTADVQTTPPTTPIPVPASLPLLLAGFGALALARRHRVTS